MIFLRAFAIWLLFIVAESLNGTIRELWLVPALGDVRAHQVGFVSGSILILTIATLFIPWLHPSRILELLQVGLLWLVLTLGFEIGLGRLILGYSWNRIAADYNLSQGGLMAFGLLLLLVAPAIAAKLRGVLPNQNQPA
ncbi:MAG: hypothetical protein IGS48_16325 [Oscillatoriales cyanobacterium C42_A2020_001]|nr:hypothetical protein [Leptolyngbyaceae cyanobacterium C42_A2020_001]